MHNRIVSFLQTWWLVLPIVSALLLPLSFYPFDLWYVGFFALVPLFYFVNVSWYSARQVFWGGFFTGAVFSIILSSFTLIQFHWLPETYLFVWLVRSLFIPIAFAAGMVGGCGALLFRTIRAKHPSLDIVTGVAVWVAIEWILATAFAGYDFGLMGYAAHAIPALLRFASIGGVFLVSALVIFVNIIIMQLLLYPHYRTVYPGFRRSAVIRSVAFACVVVGLGGLVAHLGNSAYLDAAPQGVATTTVAIIQNQQRANDSFGYFDRLTFSYPTLERLIDDAQIGDPDFVIYPFSPYGGIITADGIAPPPLYRAVTVGTSQDFAAWARTHMRPDTTLVTWGSVMRDATPYNEVDFWNADDIGAAYQKRVPFPFMDYTPRWADAIGLYSIPFDLAPGPLDQVVFARGIAIGNLLCSELSNSALARADARKTDLLFAVGSEAMFGDDIAGNFHMIVAQLRAAENNRPLVRADRLGPSAVVDASGKVIARMDYGEQGVLQQEFSYIKNPRQTIYNRIGDWGFMGLVGLWLGYAVYSNRIRSKRLGDK